MHIRELTLDDYDAALQLWEGAEHLGPVPPEEVELKLRRDPELFLVAEDDGALVGVVMGAFDGRRAWIFRLAVDSRRRREGIGAALVDELERRATAMGAPRLNLLVFPDNLAGQRFWESLGYATTDVVLGSKALVEQASDQAAGDGHDPGC